MVWGCFSASGVSNLDIVNGIIDQYVCIDFLNENFKQSDIQLGIENNFLCYQDEALCFK